MISFDEDIPHIGALNLCLGDLNFGATFILESTDGLAILANNESDRIIRYRHDIC